MPFTIPVNDMTGPQLVARHNELAAELGQDPVTRFENRAAGIRRVNTLLAEWGERPVRPQSPAAEAPPVIETSEVAPPTPEPVGVTPIDHAKVARQAFADGHDALAEMREEQKREDARPAAKVRIDTPPPADRSPTPPVKTKLDPRGVPSSDPAKDAEMPALRLNAQLMDNPPKKVVYPRREGSKQALLVDLLARPQGATFGELYDALKAHGGKPWRGVTIRSGLAWDINHLTGYGVRSTLQNGEQFAAEGRVYEANRLGWRVGGGTGQTYNPQVKLPVYRLTYPKGMTGPIPHTPRGAQS